MQKRPWNAFLTYWNDQLLFAGPQRHAPPMCQVLGLIYIIFTLVFLCAIPEARATDPKCEHELSRPARRFLGTLRTGISTGAVTSEDLQWMIQQPQPVSPILRARVPENIAMVRTFRQALRHIGTEEWNSLVRHARGTVGTLEREHSQLGVAKENTKNIFSVISSGFEFPFSESPIRVFVSSRGEPIIFTQDNRNSYFYNFATNTKIRVDDFFTDQPKQVDFFETAAGDVFCAFVQDKKLRVLNALNGSIVYAPTTTFSSSSLFPILYETNGILSVALGSKTTQHLGKDSMNVRFEKQFVPGQESPPSLVEAKHVVRLSDGHLYSIEHRYSEDEDLIQVRDLSLNKNFLRKKIKRDPPGSSNMTLIYDHGPQLIRAPVGGNWKLVNSRRSKLNPNGYPGGPLNFAGMFTYNGESVDAHLMQPEKDIRLEVVNVLRGVVDRVPIAFEPGNTWTSLDVREAIQTPEGLIVSAWELDATDARSKLHLYNLDKRELVSLPVPQNVTDQVSLFYNSADGRILLLSGLNQKGAKVYQVYGPERVER